MKKQRVRDAGADDPAESERGLELLVLLERQSSLSQRELSRVMGLSLGKTHYLLHSLLDKGLVKANNFRRSDNKLAYAYVLTPSGMREKLTLARAFLARKEREFEELRATIATLRDEIRTQEAASLSPPP
jgi:EPS-associated MarR family transcriptional regulator